MNNKNLLTAALERCFICFLTQKETVHSDQLHELGEIIVGLLDIENGGNHYLTIGAAIEEIQEKTKIVSLERGGPSSVSVKCISGAKREKTFSVYLEDEKYHSHLRITETDSDEDINDDDYPDFSISMIVIAAENYAVCRKS